MKTKTSLFVITVFLVVILIFSGFKPFTQTENGIVFLNPAADKDGKIKILLYYDMEGISGQNDMRTLSYRNKEYPPARELLTNDVNAVIDGLFAGGADAVDVVDAHGSGNPQPDILLDKMDKRAKMISRDKSFRPYCDLAEKDIYDAVAVVCMHSKTGGGGFAAHTYTIGMDWIFNGRSINETEIIAYSWGRVNVPVIFASGDDKLKEQLDYMSWLQYATVKKAKGASDADLIPLEEVHKKMREKAEKAVKNLKKSKAVRFTTPIKAQLHAVHPASLTRLNGVPGINYADDTVTFEVADYQAAYDGIEALINIATVGYTGILYEVIRKQDNGSEIFQNFRNTLIERWGDVESGRWKKPGSRQSRGGNNNFGVR